MCLIVFSYKQHPDYDLIFAANRDEFYGRPTRKAEFWDEHPSVLAGKDLEAGGTWMGITTQGYFSAVTNYRDPDMVKDNPPSRGHLVLDYLKKEKDPEEYLKQVHSKADAYSGFNLLTGTMEKLMYYSNRQKDIARLEPGLYGLSNHLLDTPWPKVRQAKSDLDQLIRQGEIEPSKLYSILTNDRVADDSELPDTGIPKELERAISPAFIRTETYGTRSSTVLLVDKNGHVTYEERRYKDGSTETDKVNRYTFEL